MKKQSNLKLVKSIAMAFLYLPIEETEFSPIVIMHPIFENGFVGIKENCEFKMINILESEDNLEKARKQWKININNAKDVMQVYSFMRKSYRLTFLKFIEKYLSKEDFAELLADAWVSSENPNQDVNVDIPTLTKWFKRADKRLLMVEEDYEVYNNLESEIKIYRGVAVGRNPKGLSWTMNYGKATWFANRFNTGTKKGYIQEATIKKENVLAYFNTRDEEEIVANIKDMTGIKRIEL